MKHFDLRDVAFALGIIATATGLYLLHPKAFFAGMAAGGVLLIYRSLR